MTVTTVAVSRRVEFSAAHVLRIAGDEEESRALFGTLADPAGHGHNYELTATVRAPIDPVTGFGVNVAELKALAHDEVTARLDGRRLHDVVPSLAHTPATCEALVTEIWSWLAPRVSPGRLDALRLAEHPRLWADYKGDMTTPDASSPTAAASDTPCPIAALTRAVEISAAHRLWSRALSDEDNRRVYGKCANANGHGHNYRIEVTVRGPVDPRTGCIIDLNLLDQVLAERVVAVLDHRHLDLDVPAFAHRVSTGENIAIVVWELVAPALPHGVLSCVRVVETSNNAFEYRGESERETV